MNKEILYKFFERQASPKEKELIKQWLNESPAHKAELFKERQFYGAMIMNRPISGDKAKNEIKPVRKKILWEMMKIAAVVLLTTSCVLFFMQRKTELDEKQPWLSVVVPSGQRANVLLPDGTNVWLNARTQIRYPGVFSGDKREIELNGEAFFEVVTNKDKPFVVHTQKCEIEVLGTKFNVEAYDDSEDFFAALIEGSVRVTSKSGPDGTNSLVLQPNYLTTLEDGKLMSKEITDFDYYRWREGLVCFRETDFAQLMHRFEKCYGVKIVIKNPRLLDYAFSGKFRIADGIDNALRVLQRDVPYIFSKNEEENTIYIE